MINLRGRKDVMNAPGLELRQDSDQLFATVSGSFRRAMSAVQEAVYALTDAGVRVLSPADPRVVAALDDFLFVASDRLRAVKPVQSRHLSAIAASDFLWLVTPDGYVGLSAAMEIGYAVASDTPIYASETPSDLTLKQYVRVVPSFADAISDVKRVERRKYDVGLLLDPAGVVEAAHADLDALVGELTRPGSDGRHLGDVAHRVDRSIVAAF